jgi:hypothetical protein
VTDAAADPAFAGRTDHMSPAVQAAWRDYLDSLEWARRFIYTRDFCDRPQVQASANQYLMQVQAAAYSWAIAPRTDYPRFHLGLLEPMVWNWGLPCPDFRYRWAFVDGAQGYRIWGKRGDARFLDFQVMSALGSVDKDAHRQRPTASYPLADMAVDADGSFEVVVSAEPREGNWIRLEPTWNHIAIFLREAFYDWANDRPSLLRIERLPGIAPQPPLPDEAEMIARIGQAGRFVRYIVEDWGAAGFDRTVRGQEGRRNTFVRPNLPPNSGANRAAFNSNMVYELGEGEALIIESDLPTSRYWSFCVGDRYLQLADFTYHQSSLNGGQARVDSDGKVRLVLAAKDPGVPNWIDPVGILPLGQVQFRQFFFETPTEPPLVTKIPFDQIRAHLPADTPTVSPDERARQLRDRSWGVLGLYGY